MEDLKFNNKLMQVKVAIIHEWLTTYAGSEKVLAQVLKLFPKADVFVVVDFMDSLDKTFLDGHKVTTSFIQHLPFAKKKYRTYLPLMPLAVEQFNLSDYDLIISSSHAVAKGVITGPDQLHISYVHSPMRYAWDLQHQYLKESGLHSGVKGWIAKYLLHRMRLWDLRTANGVDFFIANSAFIAKRIWKVYRREAKVIFPPVDVTSFSMSSRKSSFYLAASRMVPYKKMDLIVAAFASMSDKELVVIGDGPDRKKLEVLANQSPNIRILGHQSGEILISYMQQAKAFVFVAEEDFGIAPVEAQACGTPVIAFGKGGALETVVDGETGLFFDTQSVECVIDAVVRFEETPNRFTPDACRRSAERFSEQVFREHMTNFILEALSVTSSNG